MKPICLTPEPTEAEIQHAAYFLWEQEGRPAGRDRDIWLAALARLRHSAHAPSAHCALRPPKAASPFASDAQPARRKKR